MIKRHVCDEMTRKFCDEIMTRKFSELMQDTNP